MNIFASTLVLTLIATSVAAGAQWKSVVRITGQCKYKLFRELQYVGCDSNLLYGTLSNGRVVFTFTSSSPGRKSTYTFLVVPIDSLA
jgi:hypothetical protein